MKHHNNNGTEHIVTKTNALGTSLTACGSSVIKAAEINSTKTAARVADNICENCRKAMADECEMELYERADEV